MRGQLVATARYWQAHGGLPDSGVAAMEFEVAQFLCETSDRRRPQMPAERKMRLAKRLGAFTTFAGRQSLTFAPGSDPALAVHELPADLEPAEPGRGVEPDDYREVLGTALFDPGPAGSVVFRHQRYLEYLAAATPRSLRGSKRQLSIRQQVKKSPVLHRDINQDTTRTTWLFSAPLASPHPHEAGDAHGGCPASVVFMTPPRTWGLSVITDSIAQSGWRR
ncbi:MAG: hypothetical protein ACRDRH_13315 [Pseudonocardia sp.]